MKKTSAVLLVLTMLCSALFAGAAYLDVPASAWYVDAVQTVSENALMGGTGSESFSPNDNLTRGMFVTVLGRFSHAESTAASPFSDVSKTAYYAPFVAWANEKAIAGGVGQNRFAPDESITREQMAVMLLHWYEANGDDPVGSWMIHLDYTDADAISDWAYSAVAYCKIQGVLMGNEGAFHPQSHVTRAEAAQVIARIFDGKNAALFQAAIEDAKTIEPEEILPVTAITKDSKNVTWDASQKRVLLLSFHRYPESYVPGETANLKWGEVWTFTDREMQKWFDAHHNGVVNWNLRFQQVIGVYSKKAYTHVSAFWVNPEDVVRPAYVWDITKSEMKGDFETAPGSDFAAWFDEQIKGYESDSAAPWTRIGYTYDWAEGADEYGLSEFIIRKGADVEVAYTETVEQFVERLKVNGMQAEQKPAA